METAIAYIRVSDPKQVVDGNSLTTQEVQVRHLAEHRGYAFDRLFVEPGESAKTDHRPVLQEMLRYCVQKRGQIQVLVVPRIDRLARNAFDYASLKVRLSRIGIRLESVGERIEDSPVGRFTETILASVAQFDNEVRAERSRGGMLQAIQEGRWIFQAPYGYRNIRFNGRATIEPDPEEAEVVRDIFAELAAGALPNELHRRLASKGIRLTRSHFFKLIRNEAYLGVVVAFGERVQAAPPFLPLVSHSVFRAAQGSITKKSWPRTYDRHNPTFPLRGTLKCGCGKFLTASWSAGRTRRYAHYRCLTCPRVNIPVELVHQKFTVTLRQYSLRPNMAERLGLAIAQHVADLQQDVERDRGAAEIELAKVRDLRTAIARKTALGVIPDDLAKEQLAELDTEMRLLGERLNRQAPTLAEINRALDFALGFLSNLGGYWFEGDTSARKRLQRFVFPLGIPFAQLGHNRTAKRRPSAGSKALLVPKLSSVVHQHNETPSLLHAGNRRMTVKEKMEFVLEAYRLFGKPVAPEDDPLLSPRDKSRR